MNTMRQSMQTVREIIADDNAEMLRRINNVMVTCNGEHQCQTCKGTGTIIESGMLTVCPGCSGMTVVRDAPGPVGKYFDNLD